MKYECKHYQDFELKELGSFIPEIRTAHELELCHICNGYLSHELTTVLPKETYEFKVNADSEYATGTENILSQAECELLINNAIELNDKMFRKIEQNKNEGVSVRICLECGSQGCDYIDLD